MELGQSDKYVASHPAHCSFLVWDLCFVRYFMSYLVKLHTNTSPSKSVSAVQEYIGFTIGALLNVGVMFLGFTSLGRVFFPGCPFCSAFSDVIGFIFEKLWAVQLAAFQTLSRWIPARTQQSQCKVLWVTLSERFWWLVILSLTSYWVALSSVVAYVAINTRAWFSLFFFAVAFPIAYTVQQEVVHKPQKYKISRLAAWVFLFLSLLMILAIYIPTFLYFTRVVIALTCYMFSNLSKSLTDTGEIDAIAWLLTTTPPQYPVTLFKKAGQMTGFNSISRHYWPRLLETLIHFLTFLIISYCAQALEHHTSDIHPPSEPRWDFKIELKWEQSDDVLNGGDGYGLDSAALSDYFAFSSCERPTTHSLLWINRGLYSPPPIPRGVHAESELSEDSPRTVLRLNSDIFWLNLQPISKIRVQILS